ncbi:uncharacterized protein [Triticum aestivum]|uniref:uncharacterized protein isoform X1 n=1 Tax=Triticum aestivum TaxID=4565 RepID=UPI001D028EC9|nr:uncharacterized protein LOC123111849 isoform X1 [Triticum aestivum]XP_044388662.1 uncharacterized protein LOC123111849 isoform X1 [Triticum aestivum]XP_044388663.1 uncharacterized protein LOC123111849 isoform X1 [Triticum aestivum]XP_044388664.1 uncharacterized protein LOC123111849 isoform X1 [Triticum aestivum]XP_044388665.1 uncharacterized protein LOC123111849 isoform X1 [Triticum aestivum]XP_044388666.1 uncharacterized protein LOC123111849 isoform X1 [Triticum aestivum]
MGMATWIMVVGCAGSLFDAFIFPYYLQMDYALKFPFYTMLECLDHKRNIKPSDASGSHILKTQYLPYGLNQELFSLAVEDFTFSKSIHQDELLHLDSTGICTSLQGQKLEIYYAARQAVETICTTLQAPSSQKKWRTTCLLAMCKELQLLTTEQLFGKEILCFHVRQCEELLFPPFKLKFAHDFKILKQLGQGSEGEVSKCSSNFSDFKCAVKEVVPSNFLIDASTTKKHSEPSEVTLMVKLNHGNIVKMFLSWNETGSNFMGLPSDATFICMMLSARTLSYYLDQRSIIELDTVNNLFLQIMMGLEHIHKQNVVHHDLNLEIS